MKKKMLFVKASRFIIIFIALVAIFGSGFLYGRFDNQKLEFKEGKLINSEVGKPADVDFSLFWEAWNKFYDKSSKQPTYEQMLEGAISGVLSSVDDPYTNYLTQEDNQRFREDIQGEFGGIGVEIILKNDYPVIIAPLPDSPAEKAGLLPNDVIVKVDDFDVTTISFDEVINKIRGKEGTIVNLSILRQGESEVRIYPVERAIISVKSVEWDKRVSNGKNFYYVKLRQFGDDTDALFEQFVNEAAKSDASGIILDLRNNPGGYLESAINISSYFVDGGIVVSEKGRGDTKRDYKVTKKARLKSFETIVLTNSGSASASEIVAGAIMDRKAGQVIGQKTFGKGSVQELVTLSDGSAIKVTIADWVTPSGKTINGSGIEPNISVEDDSKTEIDEIYEKAVEIVSN